MRTRRRLIPCILLSVIAVAAGMITQGTIAQAIIGGTVADPNEYWFYARVIRDVNDDGKFGTEGCGGTLIAADRILTAAHCVDDGLRPDQVQVLVNDYDDFVAIELKIHPLWNKDVADGHDLAIVTLPPGSTKGYEPIQIGSPYDADVYKPGTESILIGHGAKSPDGDSTEELFAVDTPIRSDEYMDDIYNRWYWFDEWDSPLVIGAGSTGQTICSGDSGGPLLVRRDGKWIQLGVASYTITSGPARCAVPGAFAELANAQLAWVAQHVPSIKDKWGPCTTVSGNAGEPWSYYGPLYQPTGGEEGRFRWKIDCVRPGTTPAPSESPTPDAEPTISARCIKYPWKCPDE